jgi:L-asparaginase
VAEAPPVALLTFGQGDEGLLTAAVSPAGYKGLVVEATGGGHVNARNVEELERLAANMPVVLASRTGAGEVLRRTYSFVGSEVDLARRGLISAGAMTAARARMLLRLLLAAEVSLEDVRQAFAALGAPGSSAELLGGRLTVTA